MADEEKDKNAIDTKEKLIFLISDMVDRKMKEDEYVKLGTLKELVQEIIERFRDNGQPQLLEKSHQHKDHQDVEHKF